MLFTAGSENLTWIYWFCCHWHWIRHSWFLLMSPEFLPPLKRDRWLPSWIKQKDAISLKLDINVHVAVSKLSTDCKLMSVMSVDAGGGFEEMVLWCHHLFWEMKEGGCQRRLGSWGRGETRWAFGGKLEAFGGSGQILQPRECPPHPLSPLVKAGKDQMFSSSFGDRSRKQMQTDTLKSQEDSNDLVRDRLELWSKTPAHHHKAISVQRFPCHPGRKGVVSVFCSFFHLFILSHPPQSPWVIQKIGKRKPLVAIPHLLLPITSTAATTTTTSSTTATSHHHYQPLPARGFPSI